MRRHWQKSPCLIRQALRGVVSPVDRAALLALAARDDVESRLVVRQGSAAGSGEASGWRLRQGPFTRRQIPPWTQPGWTLLVQGLDLHVQAAHELLALFRFVPEARLDDLMISHASDGGGVGPHVDAYDVFLLQVQGQRRWRVGPAADKTFVDGLPLKILADFQPTDEWLLSPGDMLYVPPGWGHDGVAVGDDCMTCSIGFRAPGRNELARELLQCMLDALEPPGSDTPDKLYRDPAGSATETPGLVPAALVEFARQGIADLLAAPQSLACALGELLTEPKPLVWFEAGSDLEDGRALRLGRSTRMMYDAHHVFINGESFRAAGRDARLMRALADDRRLAAKEAAALSTDARALVGEWARNGWLHGE